LSEISVGALGATTAKCPLSFRVSAMAGSMARVTVAGELDIATSPQLERALRRIEVDPAPVFLDMRELEFMDRRGVHVILAADRRVRSAGRPAHHRARPGTGRPAVSNSSASTPHSSLSIGRLPQRRTARRDEQRAVSGDVQREPSPAQTRRGREHGTICRPRAGGRRTLSSQPTG